MARTVLGLHHITAISSDPQKTVDFYTQTLGLRLVKLTVNFDDPGTYHLYFGDEAGHPGTILTFFPWPAQPKGRHGTGQLSTTSFSIPQGSSQYWKSRLESNGIAVTQSAQRFGDTVLSFSDNDGQGLELIESQKDGRTPWRNGPVPAEHAVRGFHSATLSEEGLERTESVLVDTLGFRAVGSEQNRYRYEAGVGGPGSIIDIESQPNGKRGLVSVGTVHHVAFRAADDDEQKALRQEILKSSLNVTQVIDRVYFHSIYFREPGGVLFEAATDLPGFTIDESVDRLGTKLMLPSWLEGSRKKIEKSLRPISTPAIAAG